MTGRDDVENAGLPRLIICEANVHFIQTTKQVWKIIITLNLKTCLLIAEDHDVSHSY